MVPYEQAIVFMEEYVKDVIDGSKDELLWLLEHPSIYTAGTSAKPHDLLNKDAFPVYYSGRGGQFTYHGPGQRVAYVILNLKKRKQEDIRQYVYNLEQWVINTLERFSIKGERRSGRIGIWVNGKNGEAKIAAIGVRVTKWVTYHGIAINLNPDLSHFAGIVPCGVSEYGVTSIVEEICRKDIVFHVLDTVLIEEFNKVFYVPGWI